MNFGDKHNKWINTIFCSFPRRIVLTKSKLFLNVKLQHLTLGEVVGAKSLGLFSLSVWTFLGQGSNIFLIIIYNFLGSVDSYIILSSVNQCFDQVS